MSNQEIHQQLISYLYGELSADEVQELKDKLAKEQTLSDELKDLQDLRTMLSQMDDEPLKQPLVLATSDPIDWKKWFQNPWLQAAVVALLLMLTAALVNLRINIAPNELRVQFGSPLPEQTSLTQHQLDTLLQLQRQQLVQTVAMELAIQQDSLQRNIAAIDQHMDMKWDDLNNTINDLRQKEDTLRLSDSQLRKLQGLLMRENYQMLTDLVEYSHQYHREYTTQLVADFARYMEQQRVQDLEMISLALNDILEQNDVQQQETEYLLSTLISYVQQDKPFNR